MRDKAAANRLKSACIPIYQGAFIGAAPPFESKRPAACPNQAATSSFQPPHAAGGIGRQRLLEPKNQGRKMWGRGLPSSTNLLAAPSDFIPLRLPLAFNVHKVLN